jgi:hypothetical protein
VATNTALILDRTVAGHMLYGNSANWRPLPLSRVDHIFTVEYRSG